MAQTLGHTLGDNRPKVKAPFLHESTSATFPPMPGAPYLAAATLQIASLSALQWTMPNGLEVLLEPIEGPPWVAVAVAYDAGTRDEPRDRPGLAHLVEHLAAEQAGRAPRLAVFRVVEGAGGTTNASTGPETTLYYSEVPATHLEALLWLELQRLAEPSAAANARLLQIERKVVQKELDLRASAKRVLIEHERRALFGVTHPLAPPDLDEIKEVGRHQLEDARWFLENFYRPDQAHLVIVGGFDAQRARSYIETHFGRLSNPDRPVVRPDVPSAAPAGPAGLVLRRELPWETYRSLRLLRERVDWGSATLLASMLDDRLEAGPLQSARQALWTRVQLYRDATFLSVEARPSVTVSFDKLVEMAEPELERALSETFRPQDLRTAKLSLTYWELQRSGMYLARAKSAAAALCHQRPASTLARARALESTTLDQVNGLAGKVRGGRRLQTKMVKEKGRYESRVRPWSP